MGLDGLIVIIEGAHWVTLFIWLMLGVVFAPINRESIILFMGVLASVGSINPVYAFFISAMATYVGYSLGFFLAKFINNIFFENPSKRIKQRIASCTNLVECYGIHAILISYFIPGARHFLPVLLGLGIMNLTKFSLISFIGANIWTAVFFFPAYILGENWSSVVKHVFDESGLTFLIVLSIVLSGIVYIILKNRRKRRASDNSI